MDYDEAEEIIATLPVVLGYSYMVDFDSDYNAFIHIEGPNEWICDFTSESQIPWVLDRMNENKLQ